MMEKGGCSMKKHIALLLVLALLLTGCALPKNWSGYTAYRDMEYTRPDLDAHQTARMPPAPRRKMPRP